MSFETEMKRLVEAEVQKRSAEVVHKAKQSRRDVLAQLEGTQGEVSELKRLLGESGAKIKRLKERLRIADQNLTRANQKIKEGKAATSGATADQ